MSHEENGYVRPKDQWDCFIVDGRKGDFVYTTGFNGSSGTFKKDELVPYPDHVTATEDFIGGLRYEIFEVIDPWETLKKDGCLHVRCRQGQIVKLPANIAQPSAAWIDADRVVAV